MAKIEARDGEKDGMSQNDRAYAALKERLITLTYRPGEYLNTALLIDDLDVGRTPINHALHRLETERLVQILPRKGVIVAPLSIDDAIDLIEVRLANEALAVRLATERIGPHALDELQAICTAFSASISAREMFKMMELDRHFHEKIAAASGNPILIDILSVLHARSQRFWALSLENERHLYEIAEEHSSVLEAMRARNSSGAVDAIRFHIESFKRSILRGRS